MVYRLRVTANLFPKAGHTSSELRSVSMIMQALEYTLNRRVDHVRVTETPDEIGLAMVTFNVDGWPGDVDFMMRLLPTLPEVAFNSERIVIEVI